MQCDQLPCGHHSQSLSHCHAPWTDCISQTWEPKSTFPSSSRFYQMLCHSNENRRGRRGEGEEARHQAFHSWAIYSCNTGLHCIWFLSWQHSNIACDIHFTIMPRTLWVSPHPLLICTRLPICVLQARRACQCTRSTKFPTQTTAPCWLLARRGNIVDSQPELAPSPMGLYRHVNWLSQRWELYYS